VPRREPEMLRRLRTRRKKIPRKGIFMTDQREGTEGEFVMSKRVTLSTIFYVSERDITGSDQSINEK